MKDKNFDTIEKMKGGIMDLITKRYGKENPRVLLSALLMITGETMLRLGDSPDAVRIVMNKFSNEYETLTKSIEEAIKSQIQEQIH